jgi:hypothetical protein
MSILQQLMSELEVMQKHTTPSGVHSNPNVHGPNGLFGVEGGERDVISSRVEVNGLASALPISGTTTMYPLYPYITGKSAASGEQVEGSCADAPTAGNLLSAYQTAQFGTTQFSTRELDITTVGQTINPGESLDLRYVNDPLAMAMGRVWLNIPGQDALRYGREVLMRMVEVGMEFQQYISTKTYTGNGAGIEFQGLENLVKVNHLDARTGLAVTALDSDVRDFLNVDITTAAGSAAIVATLINMWRNLNNNARRMGFGNVQFVLVMRPQMFTDVSDVWPCQMNTFRCLPVNSTTGDELVVISGDDQIRLAQEMRQGKFLWIDGNRVPVIEDDFIPETDQGGNLYTSDIYILPLTINGGRPSLYFEYFDYSAGVSQAIVDGRSTPFMWIDRGIYMVARKPQQNFCQQWQVKSQIRLRLETPALAGRLMNVGTTFTTIFRSSNEADLGYVSDGSSGQTPPTYVMP